MNDSNGTGHANTEQPASAQTVPATAAWKEIVARYQKPSVARGVWQIINTIIPFVAIWVLMYFTVNLSWWLTVPLAILAGGFMVRMFIIFVTAGTVRFFHRKRPIIFWVRLPDG